MSVSPNLIISSSLSHLISSYRPLCLTQSHHIALSVSPNLIISSSLSHPISSYRPLCLTQSHHIVFSTRDVSLTVHDEPPSSRFKRMTTRQLGKTIEQTNAIAHTHEHRHTCARTPTLSRTQTYSKRHTFAHTRTVRSTRLHKHRLYKRASTQSHKKNQH